MSVYLSAVLLNSRDPVRLAGFYRDVIGLPLEDEQHGAGDLHYACELGDLHFAIHGTKDETGTGSVRVAFEVFDMDGFVAKVRARGLSLLSEPKDLGFMVLASMKDPDGNVVELTKLSDRWFKHLESRRAEGLDMISHWSRQKAEAPAV
jgi:predicted enzyme related to lactoylglutathione lyase